MNLSIIRAFAAILAVITLMLSAPISPLAAQETSSVEGTIRHARTGEGISGVTLTLVSTDRRATSGAGGDFAIGGLAAGTYSIRAEALGFSTATVSITLAAGETGALTLTLVEEAIPVDGVVANARRSRGVLKTEAPLLEVPQAVAVVPRRILDEQEAHTLSDAVRNVAGVALSATDQGLYDYLHIRGFYASENGNYRRNGVQSYRFGELMDFNVDRVEVIKGPSSVLYGNLEPGGIVNVVTKKPELRPFRSVTVGTGSFGSFRGAADLAGPLGSSESLLYRLNLGYEESGSGKAGVDSHGLLVAPVVTWEPTARTRITLEGEYRDRSSVADPGLLTPGLDFKTVDALPYETFLGEPDARLEWRGRSFEATLDQRLTGRWRLRATGSWNDYLRAPATVTLIGLHDDGRTVARRLDRQLFDYSIVQGEALLNGDAVTGPLSHEVVVGADIRELEGSRVRRHADLAGVDYAEPESTGIPSPDAFTEDVDRLQTDRLTGLFVQDRIVLGQWSALFGIRYSRIGRTGTDQRADPVSTTEEDHSEWSPRMGLLFRPRADLSFFGSFSESFVPTSNTDRDGNPFDPIHGRQLEIGTRVEWLEGRLIASASLYRLEKTNEVSFVFEEGFGWYTVQGGEQRSDGVEIEVLGNPTQRWGVQASFSLMDARVVSDPNYEAGRQLSGAPRHSGSLWTTYRAHPRLQIGGGLFVTGEMPSWLSSDVRKPGYATLEFFASVDVRQEVKVQFNMRNLTDVRYYDGAYATATSSHLTTNPGSPRAFEVTLRGTF